MNFIEAITRKYVGEQVEIVLKDGTKCAGTLLETAKSLDDCVVYKLCLPDGKNKTFAAPYPHDYVMFGGPYTVNGNDSWDPIKF